jgi:hypothetical protein
MIASSDLRVMYVRCESKETQQTGIWRNNRVGARFSIAAQQTINKTINYITM